MYFSQKWKEIWIDIIKSTPNRFNVFETGATLPAYSVVKPSSDHAAPTAAVHTADELS